MSYDIKFLVSLIKVSNGNNHAVKAALEDNCTHVKGPYWIFEGETECLEYDGVAFEVVGEGAVGGLEGPIACSQREEDAITIEDLREMIEPTGFESAAIASWNRLPRTPTWTTEPPKVPGWYWWRWAKYQGWMCLAVRDGLIVEHPRKVLRHAQDIGGQWAGPIPEPLEPEES